MRRRRRRMFWMVKIGINLSREEVWHLRTPASNSNEGRYSHFVISFQQLQYLPIPCAHFCVPLSLDNHSTSWFSKWVCCYDNDIFIHSPMHTYNEVMRQLELINIIDHKWCFECHVHPHVWKCQCFRRWQWMIWMIQID